MHFLNYAAAAAFAASVLAAPANNNLVEHEKRDGMPRSWAPRERAPRRIEVPVRIGLTQSNLEKAHDMLMEVSSHDSPKFAQYYTEEEIHELFAPHESSVEAVTNWLQEAGVNKDRISQSYNKQWIQFDAPIEELEQLLGAEYHIYEHGPSGTANIGCDKYHVPGVLSSHIDYITPGVKLHQSGYKKRSNAQKRSNFKLPTLKKPLPQPLSSILTSQSRSICSVAMTPNCIATLYNITAPTYTTPIAGNEMGVFEDLADIYAQEDLDDFFANLFPKIPKGTHPTLHGIDGAQAPVAGIAGGESDLDFQISYPIIYPQKLVLFQTDDLPTEEDYQYEGFLNNFYDGIDGSYCTFDAFGEKGNSPIDPPYPDTKKGGYKGKLQCGAYKPTNVISISYGGQEQDTPMNYQRRQCAEVMKLGMQGVTVVVSSGDSGVSGPAGDDNTDGCLGKNGKIFSPDFPATCPYITVLGATFLPPNADVTKDEEVAVSRFPSGGGFSNIFPIPSYQANALKTFFADHNPPYKYYESTYNSSFGANGGIYNRAGRGYPDFAAVGDNVAIFNGGEATLIGGTSASAPAFAAIITRINEERLRAGKKTVGFINPTLYAHPQVLHDITSGSNPGCGTNGFNATTGWDPVTGLGTPNFPAMLKLYLSLP